jgi:hypothetical protein
MVQLMKYDVDQAEAIFWAGVFVGAMGVMLLIALVGDMV